MEIPMINKPTYEELEQRVEELEAADFERKQFEESHRTREEEYRSTLNNLLIGVVVHAHDTSILFSNPEATNILKDFPHFFSPKRNLSRWRWFMPPGMQRSLSNTLKY